MNNKENIIKICDRLIFISILIITFILPYEKIFGGLLNASLVLALLSWITKMFISKRLLFKRTPLDYFILFYLIICIISAIFAYDEDSSFNLLRKDLFFYLIMFYIIVNNINTQDKIRTLIYAFLFSGIIVCIYSAYCYFSDINLSVGRLNGSFRQPNRYAQYLIILSSLAFSMIAIIRNVKWKAVLTGILFLVTLNIYWTFSRAGWAAFFAATLVYLFRASFKIRVMVILLILLFAAGIFTSEKARQRFTLFGEERQLVYKSALEIFKDYPIIGVGYGDKNFYKLYKSKYKDANALVNHSGTHNIFLQSAVETGIIGLIAFILLHLKILFVYIKTYRTAYDDEIKWLSLWAISSFVGVFSIGQLHTLYRDRNVQIFWLIVAIMISIYHINNEQNKVSKNK